VGEEERKREDEDEDEDENENKNKDENEHEDENENLDENENKPVMNTSPAQNCLFTSWKVCRLLAIKTPLRLLVPSSTYVDT